MLSDVQTQLDHAISRDKANNPECQRANEEGESNSSKYFSLSRFMLALHYLASIAICMSISVNLTIYLDIFAVDALAFCFGNTILLLTFYVPVFVIICAYIPLYLNYIVLYWAFVNKTYIRLSISHACMCRHK